MRKRKEYRYNPIDFEKDVAIGLTLPLTNDSSAANKFDSILPAASASAYGTGSLENEEPINSSIKSSTHGDFHLSYTTLEQAKSNLRNLVLTNRGERVMHPEFGCDIWSSMFENITPSLLDRMKKQIYKQANIWLSYINLLNVIVEKSNQENRINIKIKFALFDDNINTETITINNIGHL